MFRKRSENNSEYYKSCTELPLKVFLEIAKTGNIELLLITGIIDKDKVIDIWENILDEYKKLDNNMLVSQTFEKVEQIEILIAQYLEVKAILIYLEEVEFKEEYFNRLVELGYKVDKEKYIESIQISGRRSDNIATRIGIIKKDIEASYVKGETVTFDSVMAWMMISGIVGLNDDITVARYLEIKKQIHGRNRKTSNN